MVFGKAGIIFLQVSIFFFAFTIDHRELYLR